MVSARHVLAALRRLGYDGYAARVEAELGSAGVNPPPPPTPTPAPVSAPAVAETAAAVAPRTADGAI